jgi:hypothetical protein
VKFSIKFKIPRANRQLRIEHLFAILFLRILSYEHKKHCFVSVPSVCVFLVLAIRANRCTSHKNESEIGDTDKRGHQQNSLRQKSRQTYAASLSYQNSFTVSCA